MRDRLGFVAYLDFYTPDELRRVLERAARILGVWLTDDGAERSPDDPAAPHGSPTVCSAGYVTTLRYAPTA
jgi:hypothetical protein